MSELLTYGSGNGSDRRLVQWKRFAFGCGAVFRIIRLTAGNQLLTEAGAWTSDTKGGQCKTPSKVRRRRFRTQPMHKQILGRVETPTD